ncbi:MAG: SDR family NAD(P)-dependent oxidoreductase [Herminiimonas sp.]|uniref:SDR family NAD(P)-dependent oxidoreductase n=1 Tax=Herminiimonas sp. TaxID=1926289 RepID=UPI002723D876|nr:SDR family NAD(P)-dependent oxidoreductase [Herminiimonas sp.]MDO9420438.1 SDR family NAD(P)-dependent oxidoreductase [Herminiimonas sp.]
MNPRITDWHNKRVWIVGASTGIGAETARMLLDKGACVALSARRTEMLNEIANGNPNALVAAMDVTDHATVLAARDAILQQWDGFDLILLVAGSYQEMRADSFDLAIANQMIDLNLRGVLNCLDTVLPNLIAQGKGGIGIVASVVGFSGLPKALIYGPTKAALINLCESLYLDLHPRGIAVHLITPGFVDTPLTQKNDFPMPALMSGTDAAQALVHGLERGQFHIHFPRRFTNFLRLLRLLPYRMYFWLIHKGTGL